MKKGKYMRIVLLILLLTLVACEGLIVQPDENVTSSSSNTLTLSQNNHNSKIVISSTSSNLPPIIDNTLVGEYIDNKLSSSSFQQKYVVEHTDSIFAIYKDSYNTDSTTKVGDVGYIGQWRCDQDKLSKTKASLDTINIGSPTDGGQQLQFIGDNSWSVFYYQFGGHFPELVDLSYWYDGKLSFDAISNVNFRIKIEWGDPNNYSNSVSIWVGDYGFIENKTWQTIQIPLDQILTKLEMTRIRTVINFNIPEKYTRNTNDTPIVIVDNIYFGHKKDKYCTYNSPTDKQCN